MDVYWSGSEGVQCRERRGLWVEEAWGCVQTSGGLWRREKNRHPSFVSYFSSYMLSFIFILIAFFFLLTRWRCSFWIVFVLLRQNSWMILMLLCLLVHSSVFFYCLDVCSFCVWSIYFLNCLLTITIFSFECIFVLVFCNWKDKSRMTDFWMDIHQMVIHQMSSWMDAKWKEMNRRMDGWLDRWRAQTADLFPVQCST